MGNELEDCRNSIIKNLEIIDRIDIVKYIEIIVKDIVEDEYGKKFDWKSYTNKNKGGIKSTFLFCLKIHPEIILIIFIVLFFIKQFDCV